MTKLDDRHRPAPDSGETSRALRDFLARLAALVAADLAGSPADEPPRPDRVSPERPVPLLPFRTQPSRLSREFLFPRSRR